jgi:acyl-coenzyme A synthetase/AMP-(fatty) acid ligase
LKDDLLGEKIVALVVTKTGPLDLAQLRSHCLRWLPFVRTPRDVRCVSELPKTASTKINRASLPGVWRSTDS